MSEPSHDLDPDKADMLLQHARLYIRAGAVREAVLLRLLDMHDQVDALDWLVGQLLSAGLTVLPLEPEGLGETVGSCDVGTGSGPEPEEDLEPPPSTERDRALSRSEVTEAVRAARAFLERCRTGQVPKNALLTAQLEVGLAALMRDGRYPLNADMPEGVYHLLDGDAREAFDAMTTHNLRLAWKISQGYLGRGLDPEDVQSFAVLGLMRAVRRFDATRGYKFSTYATWWIRQHITRGLADEGALIRLPVHMHEKVLKVRRAFDRLSRESGYTSIAAVAASCGITEAEVRRVLDLSRGAVSLHVVVGEDATLGDFIADDDLGPEAAHFRRARRDEVKAAVEGLPEREASIIRMRYGLIGDEPMTLEAIGQVYGLTRERIRQLEGKALTKLRHPTRSEGLRDYVDWRLPDVEESSA
jgi:RNA polymerase primary sigma factor